MTVPGSAATEAVSDAAPAGVIAPPPLRWAAAVARVAGELDRDLVVARAGGVADADLAEGLRAVGAPFERWLDHQPGIAASEEVSDQWAAGWARTVVRLVSARRFGDASIARWVLLWVAPVVTVDLRDTTPAVLDDLVEAATRLSGSGDVTAWARAVEAGVRAWPSGMPFTRGRLRELAGVAAWRAGHVRLRTAALAAAASLPVAVSAATLGATEDQLAAALPDNATHPLRWPGVDDAPRRIGAFRGFGGAWLLPPVVRGWKRPPLGRRVGRGSLHGAHGRLRNSRAARALGPTGGWVRRAHALDPTVVVGRPRRRRHRRGPRAGSGAREPRPQPPPHPPLPARRAGTGAAVTIPDVIGPGAIDYQQLKTQWSQAWPAALACWGPSLRLASPVFLTDVSAPGSPNSFAWFDLDEVRATIDLRVVVALGIADVPLPVLAHEIGHHVLAPADATGRARIVQRCRVGLVDRPDQAALMSNLWTDLLINDRLHRLHGLDLTAPYVASRHIAETAANAQTPSGTTPAPMPTSFFDLNLRGYELLWSLPRGALVTSALPADAELDAAFLARHARVFARDPVGGAAGFAALMRRWLPDAEPASPGGDVSPIGPCHVTGSGEGVPDVAEDDSLAEPAVHPAIDPRVNPEAPSGAANDPERPPGQGSGQGFGPSDLAAVYTALDLHRDAAVDWYTARARRHLVPFPTDVEPRRRPSPRCRVSKRGRSVTTSLTSTGSPPPPARRPCFPE